MEPNELELHFRAFRDRGDIGALASVFQSTAPELLRTATVLTGDAVLGEDLLQATFVTAIERRGTWDDARPLVPWLVGILTRHARESRRRAGRHTDPERVGRPSAPEPRLAAEAQEVRRELDGSLNDLPEPLRQVLVLYLRHDLAPAEIADALGRSPSTVRSQVQRGLARLRDRLPRGIVPATALVFAEPRGLEAVRAAVTEYARRSVAPPAPATSVASTSTGALMLKTTVCLLAVTGALAFTSRPSTHNPVVATTPTATSPSPRRAATSSPPATSTSVPSRRGAVSGTAQRDASRSAPDVAATRSSRVLNVIVEDPNGAPVAGARVALSGVRLVEEPESLYGWRAGEVAPSTSSDEGLAQLVIPSVWGEMHPDAISFTINHPNFVPFCSELVELSLGRALVALEWGAFLKVSGWVSAAEPGSEPTRVTNVEAELGHASMVERGDWFVLGDGRLATGGLAPGEHHIALSWRDGNGKRYHSAITPFEIEPRGQLELSLELLLAARVSGQLAPEVPRPVRGGEVVAHQSGGDTRKLTRTLRTSVAADGTFFFADIGPGDLELAVLCEGWTSAATERGPNPVAEVAGRDADLEIAMCRTAALDLAFLGPDGGRAEDVGVSVTVAISWQDGRWQYFEQNPMGQTGADGRVRFENVPPGVARISVWHPELRLDGPVPLINETTLEEPLASGETRAVTLELVPREADRG